MPPFLSSCGEEFEPDLEDTSKPSHCSSSSWLTLGNTEHAQKWLGSGDHCPPQIRLSLSHPQPPSHQLLCHLKRQGHKRGIILLTLILRLLGKGPTIAYF